MRELLSTNYALMSWVQVDRKPYHVVEALQQYVWQQDMEDKIGLNIALDSKQQELELVSASFLKSKSARYSCTELI